MTYSTPYFCQTCTPGATQIKMGTVNVNGFDVLNYKHFPILYF